MPRSAPARWSQCGVSAGIVTQLGACVSDVGAYGAPLGAAVGSLGPSRRPEPADERHLIHKCKDLTQENDDHCAVFLLPLATVGWLVRMLP